MSEIQAPAEPDEAGESRKLTATQRIAWRQNRDLDPSQGERRVEMWNSRLKGTESLKAHLRKWRVRGRDLGRGQNLVWQESPLLILRRGLLGSRASTFFGGTMWPDWYAQK